jgi:hypothetical protein
MAISGRPLALMPAVAEVHLKPRGRETIAGETELFTL